MNTSLYVYAQQSSADKAKIAISGILVDETGEPVIGASVVEDGTTNGVATDVEGKFSLTVNPKGKLRISYIGYQGQKVDVAGKTFITVTLLPDDTLIDEVVVVGYGTQKKVSLTGAISSIKNEEIVATKNENIQNMLSGKVAGVRVVQNTSEPGEFNVSFDVRGLGAPLVVVDGVPRTTMTRINPQDVESISVLKDASAAIYGVRAGAGVVLITTRKGSKENFSIDYSGYTGWQIPSGFPDLVNAVDYMALANERSMHNENNPLQTYTDEQMAPYLDGTLKTTDWKSAVIRNAAPQSSHTISATGSNDRINYYMSLGYLDQGSFLQTNDLNYNRYNIRSNISAKVTRNLTVDMNLAGTMDEKVAPNQTTWWIIRNIWVQRPTETVYANNTPGYLLETAVVGENPVALMDANLTGNRKTKNKWFESSVSATYDVPFVKGLQFKGLYSYDYHDTDVSGFEKTYNQYKYNSGTDSYTSFAHQYPTTIRREYIADNRTLWNASINYSNRFGDSHDVSGLVLFEQTTGKGDNFYAQRELSIPVERLFAGNSENQQGNMNTGGTYLFETVNQAVAGRFNYGFQSKYLAEISFRYDASSKFPPNSRWVLFPSGSVGWRLSEERFWKNSKLAFIDNLKLRASYGTMGDDGALNYQYYQGFNYPSGGYVFDGKYVNGINSRGIPNENISWTTSKMLNAGLDFGAWNGLLGATVELFKRDREGLLGTRLLSLPDIVGASLPQENLNSDQTRGFELELSHRNHISDFRYEVKGNVSFTRTKTVFVERAASGNSWQNWMNNTTDRWNGLWWANGAAGRYESWDDIINSPQVVNRHTLPGDYIIEDWNGDGMLSDLDWHPLVNTDKVPLVNYGFTINASYKGVDLNLLFQGVAMRTISYREMMIEPLWGGTSALQQFTDRWHPADPKADPYDPNIEWVKGRFAYTGTIADANSFFNMQNAAYLRLKNVELGYTLPHKITEKAGIKNLRLYVNGYNLLTFTGLKYMDPEHTSDELGYMYPISKTVNIGLNVKF
ncbi:SusC/RagA family TonB-linked outer membrane protein [Bacteroidia bacterium]|nr:SusC/RagA family TonB-linked outer membrane protein [Bacteroidia bacterium]